VIHDDEAESASNAYLLSLVLLMVGAPLPILNLIASVIFYLNSRRGSPFVRWHSTQALLTHVVVVPVNSVFLWMTLAILFGYREPDDFYVGWFVFMAGLNATKMIGSIYSAIKVRRGVDVRWWALAPIADALMGRRLWRECLSPPLAGVLAMALVAGALTHLPWIGMLRLDKTQGRLEAKLDDLIQESLDKGGQQIRDQQLNATLRTMVDRICNANHIACKGYRIHLMRDMTVNAAALPAGHVVVYAGLVLASPNAEALEGVLGHELAHAERNHVRKKLMREIGLSVLIGAGTDQAAALFRDMVSLTYDRDMESEADRTAVDWLIEANVDPKPFADFLATLGDDSTMPLATLARTHPGSEERALEILARIPKDHAAWVPVISASQWAGFKEAVGKEVTKAE
jgi:Zn-dependent protease with chaperone function